MLNLLDEHIASRLALIGFDGSPVTVYPYIPFRDHGQTVYPCIGFKRHEHTVRDADKRPDCKLFIPGDTDVTIDVPRSMGGDLTETGPETYTEKPFPTPLDLIYEIQVQATDPTQQTSLIEMVLQTFPPGYQCIIGTQAPLFVHGRPLNLDDLDVPVFKTSFLITVKDCWLDRLEADTRTSIQTVDFDIEA